MDSQRLLRIEWKVIDLDETLYKVICLKLSGFDDPERKLFKLVERAKENISVH